MSKTNKETIAELQKQIGEMSIQADTLKGELRLSKENETRAKVARAEAECQFTDLKKHLLNAEKQIQKLEGYIARVREDDVVREPLVSTGNEDCTRLTPKRKHEFLGQAEQGVGIPAIDTYRNFDSNRSKPKHWIEY